MNQNGGAAIAFTMKLLEELWLSYGKQETGFVAKG
jgi:hypothetical protein